MNEDVVLLRIVGALVAVAACTVVVEGVEAWLLMRKESIVQFHVRGLA